MDYKGEYGEARPAAMSGSQAAKRRRGLGGRLEGVQPAIVGDDVEG